MLAYPFFTDNINCTSLRPGSLHSLRPMRPMRPIFTSTSYFTSYFERDCVLLLDQKCLYRIYKSPQFLSLSCTKRYRGLSLSKIRKKEKHVIFEKNFALVCFGLYAEFLKAPSLLSFRLNSLTQVGMFNIMKMRYCDQNLQTELS